MGKSPGHMSPRVVQLVQCLHPYGNLSHSEEGTGAVPGGYCGQCSVKKRLFLVTATMLGFALWKSVVQSACTLHMCSTKKLRTDLLADSCSTHCHWVAFGLEFV